MQAPFPCFSIQMLSFPFFKSTIVVQARARSLLSTSVLFLNVIHQSAAPTGFASIFYVVPVKQLYALSPSSEFEHETQERGL
jgi:hypothetical protein